MTVVTIKSFSSLLLLLLAIHAFGQSNDHRLIGLESEIDSLMKTYQTVGMSIAIIEKDQIIYSRGLGYRNHKKQLPVTSSTLFPIGSVTKPITASLIGVYQGKGALSVDDKPKKFVDYLEFYSDEMNNLVTIEDLLAHRSGIGVVDGASVFFPTDNIKKHLKRLVYLKPNGNVRKGFYYSNMGYAILGAITEKITGKTWAENVEKEIFAPLEMYSSNSNLTDLQKSDNFSLGYSIANDTILNVVYEDLHEAFASGAVNSSVDDLSNWVKMLLNRGRYKDQQIIPAQYLEHSFSEHNIIRSSFSFDKKYDLLYDTYGYGWFVHQYKGLYKVNHGGNVPGFTASVTMYPYKNIGVIILANQGSANLLLKAIDDIIINRLLGLERKHWGDYQIQIGQATLPTQKIGYLNTDRQPSHSLQSFCGKYSSKAYGTVEIFLENNNLMIQFPAFTMALEHQYYNTFINRIVAKTTHQNTPSFYINFYSNNEGKISKMTIDFAPSPEYFEKIN